MKTSNRSIERRICMEKKLAKRKTTRRKYKHYVAALAGAAIMAGVTFHGGMPLAKVSAAESTSTSSPVTAGQGPIVNPDTQQPIVQADPVAEGQVTNTDRHDKEDNKDKNGDKDKHGDQDRRQEQWNRRHRDDGGAWYHRDRFERRAAFMHRMERYNARLDKIHISYDTTNPVDIVRSAATELGFDVNNDTFTLLNQTGTQSIITVIHNGNSYNVTVDHLANNDWRISVVNPIS